MSENDNYQDNPQLEEKVKKNLLWVAIFSMVMLFAGITSGYIVSSGSGFWVHLTLPKEFLWSTIIIILSSLFLILTAVNIKKDKNSLASVFAGLALILGISFGVLQVNGYLEMSRKGSAARSGVINVNGKYGDYYTLFYQNKEITYDGHDYFWQGEPISKELKSEMKTFSIEIQNHIGNPYKKTANNNSPQLSNYGIFILKYKSTPLLYLNNKFELEGLDLTPEQKNRLWHFAETIESERGDFYMIGEYGKDFVINYKDTPLEYKNRTFYLNGQELSDYQLNELNGAPNRASGYIFAFVFLHALHWIGGVIALIVLFVKTLRKKYSSKNHIGLKVGSIYWHFLGILWLYLYAFLNFIH